MHPANDNSPLSGASIRFAVEPRLVPTQKAARRLHLTKGEFAALRPSLLDAGFPRPCTITGHYDLNAIECWLDSRAGLAEGGPSLTDYAALVSQRLEALG